MTPKLTIVLDSKHATVSGSPEDVIAFGIAFLRSLNPEGYSDDIGVYLKYWEEGTGVFDIALTETKAAFIAAIKASI